MVFRAFFLRAILDLPAPEHGLHLRPGRTRPSHLRFLSTALSLHCLFGT
jgi:hypothetical protein